MRSAIKRVRGAKEKQKGMEELKKTVKLLDQLASKGVIHRNKAANQKSALTLVVNKLKELRNAALALRYAVAPFSCSCRSASKAMILSR
jgi:hypothetical protein